MGMTEVKAHLAPIREAPEEVRLEVLCQMVGRPRPWGKKGDWDHQDLAAAALDEILRKVPELPLERLPGVVEDLARNRPYQLSDARMIGFVARAIPEGAASPALDKALETLRQHVGQGATQEERKLLQRLDAVCGVAENSLVEPGEDWSDALLAELERHEDESRAAWQSLVQHAGTATTSKPSKRWLKTAASLRESLQATLGDSDGAQVLKSLLGWLQAVKKPSEPLERIPGTEYGYLLKPPISDRNAEVLRGLVWITSQLDAPEVPPAIAGLAEVCFKKIPDFGPVNKKVGNACLWGLANTTSLVGVAWLSKLEGSVRYASAKKQIGRVLAQAAERAGVTPQELEEMALPTFGLDQDACKEVAFGDWIAEVSLGQGDKPLLHFKRTAAGKTKTQKSVPKDVREQHKDEVKDLRAELKTLEKLLPGQRRRFEAFFLEERTWPYPLFRERYIDHPLAAHFAKRLIWRV